MNWAFVGRQNAGYIAATSFYAAVGVDILCAQWAIMTPVLRSFSI